LTVREAVFVYSQELEEYQYPPEHPFNTIRAKKVRETAAAMGLLSGAGPLGAGRREVAPVPAERIVLKKFHSARYLHALKNASEGKLEAEAFSMGLGTPDCPVFKGMYDGAVLAVGGTLVGAKLILSGSADVAFNPSGGFHHAGPERASGFCYINDVALACIILAEAGKKVLYLDVDVHHGDGVAYAFYDRCDVMTISFHEVDNTVRAWSLAWSLLRGGGGSRQEGLRDKTLAVSSQQRDAVTPRIETTIEAVKANVFSYHGL